MRLLGAPVKLSRTPADTNRLPGPCASASTPTRCCGARATPRTEIAALKEGGAVAGHAADATGSFLS